jgi:hypothetical protein
MSCLQGGASHTNTSTVCDISGAESGESECSNQCCILHLDSLNLHKDHLMNPIFSFLNEEFAKRNPGVTDKVFTRKTCPVMRPREVSSKVSHYV